MPGRINCEKMTSNLLRISFLLCLLACAKFSFAQVAVIAHKAVPDDTLSQAQLLDVFSGEVKFWSNKVRVVVFDLKPAGEAKDAFYKLLGKTPSRMKSIWLKKLLMGEGDPPEALASEEEVLKKVAATPGAIGFVGKTKATPEVRMIVIVEKK
jgi:ABC-type phosphate transport system substrate-binding protein